MGHKQREELMSSLKLLYDNGEYSDLTIICRGKHYLVHKAIVCPRSRFFTTCDVERKGIVNLPDDDPWAVERVVHYLYHLDYSSMSMYLEGKATSMTSYENGAQIESDGHSKINGHDSQVSEDVVLEAVSKPMEEPVSIEHRKEKRKKKKRKASIQSQTEGSTTELKDSLLEETGMNDEPAAEEAIAPPQEESLTYSNLLLHAKVYMLSKKYGIEGLKALALEKFEGEANQNWASDDLLQAAKEAYTSNLEDDDRGIKDVITRTLYEHPEMLDNKKAQKVIKGLELGFDLLMRVRINGGFGNC